MTEHDQAAAPDPTELLRSRSYIGLLVLGAIAGVPISALAYFFLKAVGELQHYIFSTLWSDLGFDNEPLWWPVPFLAVGGLLVALIILRLPGTAGHRPAEGFKSGSVEPIELPGIVLAALVTLSCGAVLGPEAPLIALGSGLGVLAVRLVKRDAPATAAMLLGAAGSFAAVSTLLGSPIVGAFLLMEVAGVGGPMLGVILVPGMLAAGVGALIFVGLDSWTGFGTFSLAVPDLPPVASPTGAEFLWALGIGLAAAGLGALISRGALALQDVIARRALLLTPVAGIAMGLAAMLFAGATDHGSSEVLFSGQEALPSLLQNPAAWSVGALALLVLCKGIAYCAALSSFRGGPVFPGMFIGAAGGLALSHLPGLSPIAGAAMGIGAMTTAMLRLPLTSVLLTTVFLQSDGLSLMPLVIVAVVVSYVMTARLTPAAASSPPRGPAAPAPVPARDDPAVVT